MQWVAKIREHAMKNYEKDGWDFLVECWTDQDIYEEVKDFPTYAQAKKWIATLVGTMDEQRAEARALGGDEGYYG